MITTLPTDLSISPSLLTTLRKEGDVRTVPVGTVILDQKNYIRSVPIVLKGLVKVFRVDEEAGEILLYYIKPGESCVMSFLGAVCHGTSKVKAVVEEDAEILMLPVDRATALARDNPQWLQFIFELYNRRFEELLSVVDAVTFQKMDDRLWELLQMKIAVLKTRELNVTHQQIADELGTAREVVSRLLKQLERENKVTLSRNKITVLV